jgi:hypothetical protein
LSTRENRPRSTVEPPSIAARIERTKNLKDISSFHATTSIRSEKKSPGFMKIALRIRPVAALKGEHNGKHEVDRIKEVAKWQAAA